MAFKGELVRLLSQTFSSNVMAWNWWWNSIEAYLLIRLSKLWYDDAIEISWLCGLWDYAKDVMI